MVRWVEFVEMICLLLVFLGGLCGCFGEGLFEVGFDVVDVFDVDGDVYLIGFDVGGELFFGGELLVGCVCWVDD